MVMTRTKAFVLFLNRFVLDKGEIRTRAPFETTDSQREED